MQTKRDRLALSVMSTQEEGKASWVSCQVPRRWQSAKLTRTDRALAMAKEIAGKSPIAVIGTKHLMNRELSISLFTEPS